MFLGTVRYDDIPSSNGNGRVAPPHDGQKVHTRFHGTCEQ